MSTSLFEERCRELETLVRSDKFLRGTSHALTRLPGVAPRVMTLDRALVEIAAYSGHHQESIFGPKMSFSDNKSRLLSKCKRAQYSAADPAAWRERIFCVLGQLDTHVHRRVEEEGGEPGVAGEVYCDFQMLLLVALSADKAVADVRGGAAYLSRVAKVYHAGGFPVGWLGLFPVSGEMLVWCAS